MVINNRQKGKKKRGPRQFTICVHYNYIVICYLIKLTVNEKQIRQKGEVKETNAVRPCCAIGR